MESRKTTTMIPLNFGDTTPENTTPIRPSAQEMHPERHHQSTAKPMEEARWLGFSNMAPHTEPPKHSSKIATLQGTPTRTPTRKSNMESPKIQFTFAREQSLELSPAAKLLMSEKREEAAKIRAEMVASGEAEGMEGISAAGRRIATPKGKKGRFSDMHKEEFKKMDSIANHPAALRAAINKSSVNSTPVHIQTEGQKVALASPTKSLKRSQSKAELDEHQPYQQRSLPRSSSKPNLGLQSASQLPRSHSTKTLGDDSEQSSPSKRVKRFEAQDVSIARPSSQHSEKASPATPASKIVAFSKLATPTQASLARATSIKAVNTTKIPAPPLGLARSPSKPSLHAAAHEATQQSTPLLSRSPSKASLFSRPAVKAPEEDGKPSSPLLLRSPLKSFVLKKTTEDGEPSSPQVTYPSLLSRAPRKGSVAKNHGPEASNNVPALSTPLLSRSPAKITMPVEKSETATTSIPTTGSKLLGRFNLLRASPMKSILRSPQRLYSDDPSKVAAGTHLATPPKIMKKASLADGTITASAQKRVDFSSSTKARYERAQSELSSTPTKAATPSPRVAVAVEIPQPSTTAYPTLPSRDTTPMVSPQKRRQTATPADFTFRAGQHNIIFSQSPNAPPSNKRASTIRHVSAEPKLPSAPLTTAKKRKFDFENRDAGGSEKAGDMSDKENAGVGDEEVEERPAKRMKQSAPSPSPSPKKSAVGQAGGQAMQLDAKLEEKKVTRRPTLGVKPKKGSEGAVKEKEKKASSTISRARLNALAQPKKRA